MPNRRVALVAAAAAVLAESGLIYLGRTYGSTKQERRKRLPGDDIIPEPVVQTDHAITIDAPRLDVDLRSDAAERRPRLPLSLPFQLGDRPLVVHDRWDPRHRPGRLLDVPRPPARHQGPGRGPPQPSVGGDSGVLAELRNSLVVSVAEVKSRAGNAARVEPCEAAESADDRVSPAHP